MAIAIVIICDYQINEQLIRYFSVNSICASFARIWPLNLHTPIEFSTFEVQAPKNNAYFSQLILLT